MPTRQSRKHTVTVNGHSTSVTLEDAFWNSLKDICEKTGKTVNQLATELDATGPENLSSAIRVYILEYYKNQ